MLRVGDEILAINGESIVDCSHLEVDINFRKKNINMRTMKKNSFSLFFCNCRDLSEQIRFLHVTGRTYTQILYRGDKVVHNQTSNSE